MKRLAAIVLAVVSSTSCLFTDSYYEGTIKRCDEFDGTRNALLIIDNPRAPTSFTGWWGVADDSQRNTWDLAEITDGESSTTGLKFEVEYSYSSGDSNSSIHSESTSTWEIELEPTGNGTWEGKATVNTTTRSTIFNNTTTTESEDRCDIELEEMQQ